jgi:hypothetical protein
MRRLLLLVAGLALALSACDSGGSGAGDAPAADPIIDPGDTVLAASGEVCESSPDCLGGLVCFQEACTNPTELVGDGVGTTIQPSGQDCDLDQEKLGKEIGDLVGNFALPDQDGQTYELYDNCGTDKKAIWIVLAAGW